MKIPSATFTAAIFISSHENHVPVKEERVHGGTTWKDLHGAGGLQLCGAQGTWGLIFKSLLHKKSMFLFRLGAEWRDQLGGWKKLWRKLWEALSPYPAPGYTDLRPGLWILHFGIITEFWLFFFPVSYTTCYHPIQKYIFVLNFPSPCWKRFEIRFLMMVVWL